MSAAEVTGVRPEITPRKSVGQVGARSSTQFGRIVRLSLAAATRESAFSAWVSLSRRSRRLQRRRFPALLIAPPTTTRASSTTWRKRPKGIFPCRLDSLGRISRTAALVPILIAKRPGRVASAPRLLAAPSPRAAKMSASRSCCCAGRLAGAESLSWPSCSGRTAQSAQSSSSHARRARW